MKFSTFSQSVGHFGRRVENKYIIGYIIISGVFAMETLHQKVLPFILRRMKEDVLKDLPPKITQVSFLFVRSFHG